MKNLTKIFFAVAVAMFAFACVTDTTEDLGIKVEGQGGVELTLSLEESRTQLGEKVDGLYPLYWSEGDKISVNGVESGEAIINESNPASATFAVQEAESYAVAYPAAPAGQVLFAEKQSHVAEGNTFASGVSTMYGYGTDRNAIQLNHLTGVLKVGIKGEAKLAKAQISTIDRAPIAGAFDIDFTTGELEATTASKDVIEYSFGEGLQLTSEAQYIYVAVPAGQYDELYITLYEKGNSGNIMYATVKAGDSKPLTAGNVREFSSSIVYAPNAQLYVINSVETLQAFKAAIESTEGLAIDAILTEDIDMTGVEWTPIAGENYVNTLIGNGYAIKGLTAPLFAATSASFKGVHLEDVNITITDRNQAGALACSITATDTVSPKVENCSVSGSVTINNTQASAYSRYGTLVGVVLGVKVDECVNNATFTITKPYGEGNKRDVSVGGIIGWIREFTKSDATVIYSELNNSVNNGKVSYEDASTLVDNLYIGGLTASSSADNKGSMLCNNTNNGEVSLCGNCTTLRIGGISGYAKGTQVETDRQGDNNTNNGKLVIKKGATVSTLYFGGIIAHSLNFSYSNCHNFGTIELEEGATINTISVGGITATAVSEGDKDNAFVIHDCTNNAPINIFSSSPATTAGGIKVAGITAYTQGDLQRVTNNKEGVITIGGVINTKGGRATADGNPRHGGYIVAGICGYKTVDSMIDCTNHGDINLPGTIVELHASTISEFRVAGIVGYTSKNGSGFVSDGKITLNGTYGCEMSVAGSIAFHYNTISGEEKSSTKIEISGDCSKGLVVGGVVGYTYVKASDLEYNGSINVTKDAVIGTKCYIGGCAGLLMSAKGTAYSSPNGVYCNDCTNNGAITVNGTINCAPCIGGVVGYNYVGVDGAKVYSLNNLTNNAAITLGADGSVPSNNLYIAGCIGHAEGTVTTATNLGAITVSGSSTGGNSYIAGCAADVNVSYTISGLTNEAAILCNGTVKSARMGGVGGYIGIIENSLNTGNVTFTGSATSDSHCYGISYYSTTMKNCVNGSETDSNVGKLIYNTQNGGNVFLAGLARQCITKAENCTNYGNMYLDNAADGTIYLGGMFASGVDNATYVSEREGCHNYGNIYVNADIAPEKNFNCFVGGFTYRNNNAFSFKDCHNHGDIILKEGIKIGNSIRMGGFIGTMETGVNVTFNGCSNSGDIIVPKGVVCGNTTTNTTGYIRAGGIVGNQSAGTVTVLNYLKNTGKISVAGECKHKQSISIGGVFGYTKHAFTAESNAVLINEGIVENGATATAGGLRAGGVIGAADATHPATVSFVNTGDVTCTGTFTSNAYIGGVFGNTAASQANAQSFCEITAIGYTGVGMITGSAYSAGTVEISNSAIGGKITATTRKVTDTDTGLEDETPMTITLSDTSNVDDDQATEWNDYWYKYIYGSGNPASAAEATGCSLLTSAPSLEAPAPDVTPEETPEA